jgi:import inner membrane translocase subunit TIM50
MNVRSLLRLRRAVGVAAFGVASAVTGRQIAGCAATPAPTEPPAAPPAEKTAEKTAEASVLDKVVAPVRGAYDTVAGAVYDNVIKPYAEPSRDKLLPELPPNLAAKPTLVVSLDGLLIESVYTRQHGWRYIKRPGLDAFLDQLYPFYEIVLWTDCLANADPVVDKFDERRRIRHRLYRDTTTYRDGKHYKDLSVLNRDLKKVLIIDTDKEAFAMQPDHGIDIPKYDHTQDPDQSDKSLTKLIPLLQYLALSGAPDLSAELKQYEGPDLAASFQKKLPELRASGKLRLPVRVGATAGESGSRGPTIWDRLRKRE